MTCPNTELVRVFGHLRRRKTFHFTFSCGQSEEETSLSSEQQPESSDLPPSEKLGIDVDVDAGSIPNPDVSAELDHSKDRPTSGRNVLIVAAAVGIATAATLFQIFYELPKF